MRCISIVYMATEMINIRLEKDFLAKIDKIVERNDYQSRTELVRDALRKLVVEDEEYQKLKNYYAKFRKKHNIKGHTTDEELRKIREEVFDELYKDSK